MDVPPGILNDAAVKSQFAVICASSSLIINWVPAAPKVSWPEFDVIELTVIVSLKVLNPAIVSLPVLWTRFSSNAIVPEIFGNWYMLFVFILSALISAVFSLELVLSLT